jgi:hypothetical protein
VYVKGNRVPLTWLVSSLACVHTVFTNETLMAAGPELIAEVGQPQVHGPCFLGKSKEEEKGGEESDGGAASAPGTASVSLRSPVLRMTIKEGSYAGLGWGGQR